MLAKMERMRLERNRADEEALIRRMKDECNQALARQWKLAQEQMNRVRFLFLCSIGLCIDDSRR